MMILNLAQLININLVHFCVFIDIHNLSQTFKMVKYEKNIKTVCAKKKI